MLNFRPLAPIDTWDLIPSLRDRLSLFRPGDRGERVIPIRFEGEKVAWTVSPAYGKNGGKWPELAATLNRIQRIGEQIAGKVERGRIFLEMLDPGAQMQWRTETGAYYDRYLRVHLPIRTNPAAVMYAGMEFCHLPAGQLTLVGVKGPTSASNMGDFPVITLVCDFRSVVPAAAEKTGDIQH